jgi:hypothetical protein
MVTRCPQTPVAQANTQGKDVYLFTLSTSNLYQTRVQLVDSEYVGEWELPVLGVVTAPIAVLIRSDGYVAWVGEPADPGLADALASWFGAPIAT